MVRRAIEAEAAAWAARPLAERPGLTGAVRWGVVYVRDDAWVAYGSEARCRALVAQLTAADAGPPPAGPVSGARPG